MGERRYTVCTYYPDLRRPDRAFDFAVLAASPDGLAMVGVNLTAYGLKDDNPFAQSVLDRTFDVMVRRVEEAFSGPGLGSCLKALDRLVSENRSNIQYRPVVVEASDDDPTEIALRVFRRVGFQGRFWPAPGEGPEGLREPPAAPARATPAGTPSPGGGRPESRRVEIEVFA